MYYSLLFANAINGNDLPDNILVPFAILLIIMLINRINRTFSQLTGFDIIITILVLKLFLIQNFEIDMIYIEPFKMTLLVYFALRIGIKSKRVFNQINNVKLLKFSLFDMFFSVVLLSAGFGTIVYFFFPYLLEKQFDFIFAILVVSLIFTIGSKSLFKNFYAKQIDQKDLFITPFILIDIHQIFIFILSGLFILFNSDTLNFFNLDQSKAIFYTIGIGLVLSVFFGLILNRLKKKREVNIALISFSAIIAGYCMYFNLSPMFLAFLIGLFSAYFINEQEKYQYLSNQSKHLISSLLIVFFILEIELNSNFNFYLLLMLILLIRFIVKFVIQKITSFYFDVDQLAIPGLQMLFLGQGKTSLIILMYFFVSFDHMYENEIKLIALASVIVFEFIGILRSKPEHIMSNKSMMKELDT